MVSDAQAHETTQWWVEYGKVARKFYQAKVDLLLQVQLGAAVQFNPPGGAGTFLCIIAGFEHRSQVLRCAPPAEAGWGIDGVECGRWSFRSERVPGAERWNGGTVAG